MIRIQRIIAGVLVASLLSQAPAAATILSTEGFLGDAEGPSQCEDGRYLIGLSGRVGSWVDSIGVICATLYHDNSVIEYVSAAALLGGGGGSPVETRCAINEVVDGVGITFTKAKQIAKVELYCTNVAKGGRNIVVFGNNGGGYSYLSEKVQTCPQGERATGFNVRYGKHVNGLGTICRPLVLPPKPKPAPNAYTSNPQDFQGTWATEVRKKSGHVPYDIILWVLGGDKVSGAYTSPGHPEWDGTISGSINSSLAGGVRLEYTWTSAATSASGEGSWKVTTDGRLVGRFTVVTPGQKPISYPWEGSRVSRYAPGFEAARKAAEASAKAAAEGSAKASAEYAADYDPNGKSAEQCLAANQRNEIRCMQLPPLLPQKRAACSVEAAVFRDKCLIQAQAAEAAAGANAPAPGKMARVILPVEVFDAPGGAGNIKGDLAAQAIVTIVAEPGDDWFEVSGDAVPGGRGFVYSGDSYRSLEKQ